MALSANTVWEVRPSVGNDTNGGGFVTGATGTDFSQQNSKNSGGNNGSVTDGVGVGTTTFTSATASFTSAIVGNIVYISGSGLTTDWYQVVSFSNGTTIVLDRSPGTGTGATLNIGGALSTIAQAYTTILAGSVAGMTIFCKATGTYTTTTTQVLSTQWNPPISLIGYTTTRGDNGKVTWTTSTNSIKLISYGGSTPQGFYIANFNFTCTAGTPGDCFHAASSTGNQLHLRNCIFSGFNSALNGNFAVDWALDGILLEDCEIKSSVTHGIYTTGLLTLIGCTIHNNGGSGIFMHVNNSFNCSIHAVFTAIKSNTADGITYDSFQRNAFCCLVNCDIVSNGSDGVEMPNGSNIVARNTIFYGQTAYALNVSSGSSSWALIALKNNALGSNGSGNYNQIYAPGSGYSTSVGDATDVTLTADPFTGRTSTPPDLSLNSTTGGGPLCTGTGSPATLPFS